VGRAVVCNSCRLESIWRGASPQSTHESLPLLHDGNLAEPIAGPALNLGPSTYDRLDRYGRNKSQYIARETTTTIAIVATSIVGTQQSFRLDGSLRRRVDYVVLGCGIKCAVGTNLRPDQKSLCR
jgi:hypothetical protein